MVLVTGEPDTRFGELPAEAPREIMGKLTGTQHGDAANDLVVFYQGKARELADLGQYFMAAIALGFALETVVLAYLLVEFGEDNGGELQIPDSVNLSELIAAADQIDVLDAPINQAAIEGGVPPKHIAKDVIHKIRHFRNLIHPARMLKESFKPRDFSKQQFEEIADMYDSVYHSLIYYL